MTPLSEIVQNSNTVQRQSKLCKNISLGNGYIGFPYYPLVRPKRHRTACAISPKGKARTFKPRVPSGPYITPSNGYIEFPYYPLVRPKRHGTACAIGPKGEARTHGPRAPSVPKVKLRYLNRVQHWVILPLVMAILGFLTIP